LIDIAAATKEDETDRGMVALSLWRIAHQFLVVIFGNARPADFAMVVPQFDCSANVV
jgi:hypothetical protein